LSARNSEQLVDLLGTCRFSSGQKRAGRIVPMRKQRLVEQHALLPELRAGYSRKVEAATGVLVRALNFLFTRA